MEHEDFFQTAGIPNLQSMRPPISQDKRMSIISVLSLDNGISTYKLFPRRCRFKVSTRVVRVLAGLVT